MIPASIFYHIKCGALHAIQKLQASNREAHVWDHRHENIKACPVP